MKEQGDRFYRDIYSLSDGWRSGGSLPVELHDVLNVSTAVLYRAKNAGRKRVER